MKCNLCPNYCNVDRQTNVGKCGVNNEIKIAKYYLHKFEEPLITGKTGSGTIFFCGCSLRCVFCQNYELSRNMRGKTITTYELAKIFKELEDMGATNINLVTPSHYLLQIIEALNVYKPKIPIVYNTHSYENLSSLKLIDQYVDVYLPDIKYYLSNLSQRYCGKDNYFEIAKTAIEFMINSKPIKFADDGTLKSGTVVRHLVLPQNVIDSKNILDWFNKFKDKAFFSLMSQYTPFGQIQDYPELNRKITKREYQCVLDYAINLNINNLYYQEIQSADRKYIPNWDF